MASEEDMWLDSRPVYRSDESIVGVNMGAEETHILVTRAQSVVIVDSGSGAVLRSWVHAGPAPTQASIAFSADQYFCPCGQSVVGWNWADRSTASRRREFPQRVFSLHPCRMHSVVAVVCADGAIVLASEDLAKASEPLPFDASESLVSARSPRKGSTAGMTPEQLAQERRHSIAPGAAAATVEWSRAYRIDKSFFLVTLTSVRGQYSLNFYVVANDIRSAMGCTVQLRGSALLVSPAAGATVVSCSFNPRDQTLALMWSSGLLESLRFPTFSELSEPRPAADSGRRNLVFRKGLASPVGGVFAVPTDNVDASHAVGLAVLAVRKHLVAIVGLSIAHGNKPIVTVWSNQNAELRKKTDPDSDALPAERDTPRFLLASRGDRTLVIVGQRSICTVDITDAAERAKAAAAAATAAAATSSSSAAPASAPGAAAAAASSSSQAHLPPPPPPPPQSESGTEYSGHDEPQRSVAAHHADPRPTRSFHSQDSLVSANDDGYSLFQPLRK
jgi:hypothetical protein